LLPINKIICGDCLEVMKDIPQDYISVCITDPPYNYEFIGHKWNEVEIKRRMGRIGNKENKTLVKNIPYGSGLSGGIRNSAWYKKYQNNILEYMAWCYKWAVELFRICKPGAVVLVFNSNRSVAHIQVAFETAGFYTRDVLVYKRSSGIPKGVNIKSQLKKLNHENLEEGDGLHSCLRNEWEAICVLQKPLKNNYVTTFREFGTGLFYTKTDSGGFQSNVIEGIVRDKKDMFNIHCNVKPLSLMKKLINIFTPKTPNSILLDPFVGSGTTCVAAKEVGQNYIGIDINQEYCDLANKRIEEAKQQINLF
jgi:site-specific DNA-methyltransferase (adenine-specific)